LSGVGALYRGPILDHGKRPRNFREITGARRAERDNPLCGDRVVVFVDVGGDCLRAVSFLGGGCSILTASASMMTERLAGATRAEVGTLMERFRALVCLGSDPAGPGEEPSLGALAAFAPLADFPGREPCATLPWLALRAALADD
jgi:nitrogen fixation NifU-like protein